MKNKHYKNLKGLTVEELNNYFKSKGLITDSIHEVINIIQPIKEFYGITAPIVLAQIFVNDEISVTLNVTTDEQSELLLMGVFEMFIEDAQNTIK